MARYMSGQHQHCLYSSSTVSHPFVPVFTVFPRVLSNRGRQQPRGRAYSAVWIQGHLHKSSCNYLLREEGREVGVWRQRERDGWGDVGEGSEERMCTGKQEGEPGKAAQKRGTVTRGMERTWWYLKGEKRFFIQRFISGPEVVLFNVKGSPI